MLRSFSYAAYSSLIKFSTRHPKDIASLEPWAQLWVRCVAAEFLRAYRESAQGAEFLPVDSAQFRRMLEVFLVDQALYEVLYELNERPALVRIPLMGILSIVGKKDVPPIWSNDMLTGPLTISAVLKGPELQIVGDAYPTGDNGVHFVLSIFNRDAFDFSVHELDVDVLAYAPLNLDHLLHGVGATKVRRYFRATIDPKPGSYGAIYEHGGRRGEFVTIPPGKSEVFDVEISTQTEGLYDVCLRVRGGLAGEGFNLPLDSTKRRVAFFDKSVNHMVDRGLGEGMLTYEKYSLELESWGLSDYAYSSEIRERLIQALKDPKWGWRSLKRLAIEAAVSEEKAADVLRADPRLRFGQSKSGAIVGLRARAEIFMSYKRNVEPDRTVVENVANALRARGHSVFLDRHLKVGEEWAREIEEAVRRSDFLIVFLSRASSNSEMVTREVEIARDEAAKSDKGPRILPVRLSYTDPLPYPLSAWLDRVAYFLWRGEEDTDQLVQLLETKVAGASLPASPMAPAMQPPHDSPPLYSATLQPPGGGLDVDDPWYVRRSSDDNALGTISQQGVTLVIKGSRQMGKTSLLLRTLSAAMQLGKRCVLVDFQLLGTESLASSNVFFRNFARAILEGLDLGTHSLSSWDSGLADSQNLTRLMEREVLQVVEAPIVLGIDEADMLLETKFLYDFFGMLRSWHNRRADPLKKRLWKRLDLVLVTSTEPYLFIDRDHESPFNVGEVVPLSDFGIEQVQQLNVMHQNPLLPAEVDRIYDLLHGQPYLTRKAFYVVKTGLTPDQLFAQAAQDGGPFGDHLRGYFLRLLNHPEVAAALKQVALGRGCTDRKLAYRLESAGLVKSEAGKVVPRCSLYGEYFRDRL
jgi:hypothetical protein